MELYDLNKLVRDDKQDGLYNLFDPTFKMIDGIETYTYIVLPEHEMRIDLVCNEIYGNVDNCDFLLCINDIDNPLNIMSGDIINYVDMSSISEFQLNVIDESSARNTLLNSNKSTRIDPNRKKYIDGNYSLPPTFLSSPEKSVKIENDQIVIGGK